MESAPLLKAHSHANSAARYTRKADISAAQEEHRLAAADFASAAKSTEDSEALRILKLLEDHHQRLASIIKSQTVQPAATVAGDEIAGAAPPLTTDLHNSPPAISGEEINVQAEAASQPAQLAAASSRKQSRDLTSSIASNLANARGIPGSLRRGSVLSPSVSAQNAKGKLLGPPVQRLSSVPTSKINPSWPKEGLDKASLSKKKVSETVAGTLDNHGPRIAGTVVSEPTDQTTSEEPFQHFYATFEGLLSKISAPLAFAGLPIGREEVQSADRPDTSSATTVKSSQVTVKASADPDFTKLFSKAALRAIKEDSGFGPAESFYVVPTTGGSARYADVASRADQSAVLPAYIPEEADEEFVDARETPQTASPEASRRYGQGAAAIRAPVAIKGKEGKTMEELEQVNRDLKREVDQLAKTLYAWQTSAQEAQERSMALHASFRTPRRTSSALAPVTPMEQEDGKAEEKLKNIEDQMRTHQKEMERTLRENEKLRTVVGRYRERWEKLKEGARVRREGGGGVKGDNNPPQT